MTVQATGPSKLSAQPGRAAIKVEVNTTMRGLLSPARRHSLCVRTQETFDMDVEVFLAPAHQMYGAKLVAALDRQHPRDLFDVRHLVGRERPWSA